MTLRIPTKVLLHVWSYDFYDMTLSTGKQRRHMINIYILCTLKSRKPFHRYTVMSALSLSCLFAFMLFCHTSLLRCI